MLRSQMRPRIVCSRFQASAPVLKLAILHTRISVYCEAPVSHFTATLFAELMERPDNASAAIHYEEADYSLIHTTTRTITTPMSPTTQAQRNFLRDPGVSIERNYTASSLSAMESTSATRPMSATRSLQL